MVRHAFDAGDDAVRQRFRRAMGILRIRLSKVGDRERLADANERVAAKLASRLELQADGHDRQVQREVRRRFGLQGDPRGSSLERCQMRLVLCDPLREDCHDVPIAQQPRELLEGADVSTHPLSGRTP